MNQELISEFFSGLATRFRSLPIAARFPLWILFWPILVSINLLNKQRAFVLRVASAVLLIALFQYQWLFAFYSSIDGSSSKSGNSTIANASSSPTATEIGPTQVANPTVDISLLNFQNDCSESRMKGTISVVNNGNVVTSGRVSVPVSSFEKYEIPLSGVFVAVQPKSQATIELKSDFECKDGQLLGEPRVDFTYPNGANSAIGVKDAFEWSNFKYRCDSASELISFKATVKNISTKRLSAGVIARLSTEEVNYTINYWSPITNLDPQESREIDFGYDGVCNLKRGGTKGPYEPAFEVIFSY